MSQKTIETDRLVIRSSILEDLPGIHRILDQTFGAGNKVDDETALQERRSWLQWSILSQEWLPQLHQPPYGDRAIILKATRELIGSVGYVPLLDVYEQIPELANSTSLSGYNTTEFGLFWVIDPHHQRQGYATEAAQAMIEYALKQLRLKRVIATTEYSNVASQGVMQKVGMKIARNPSPHPFWLQVVGIIENGGKLDDITRSRPTRACNGRLYLATLGSPPLMRPRTALVSLQHFSALCHCPELETPYAKRTR